MSRGSRGKKKGVVTLEPGGGNDASLETHGTGRVRRSKPLESGGCVARNPWNREGRAVKCPESGEAFPVWCRPSPVPGFPACVIAYSMFPGRNGCHRAGIGRERWNPRGAGAGCGGRETWNPEGGRGWSFLVRHPPLPVRCFLACVIAYSTFPGGWRCLFHLSRQKWVS